MSRIQAKFKVHSTSGDQQAHGGKTIYLQPVYSSDPNSPNYSWSQATPSGEIRLFISNPAAADAFELGAEYLVDFTKVEQAEASSVFTDSKPAGDDVTQQGATS